MEYFGKIGSTLTVALVVVIVTDVILRYFFANTKTWIIELEWHMFSLIFLLGAAYAFQKDEHVRVDVFYARFSEKKKATINLIGILLFVIPWCLVVIYTSWNYAYNSFSFREASPNPGGLPARYIIKFCITAGFLLLMLQSIAQIVKSIKIIIKK